MMLVTRSNPMPVSTCRAGRGEKVPSGFALNWMNTKFHISIQRASPWFTSLPPVSPCGVRSTCNSEHGPHGFSLAHHPEIILFVAMDDVRLGVQTGRGELGRPKIIRLLVEVARIALRLVRRINRPSRKAGFFEIATISQ